MMEHNFLLGALSLVFLALMAASAGTAPAQTGDSELDELARDLANPLADLTSVPFQFNCNANIRGLGIVP